MKGECAWCGKDLGEEPAPEEDGFTSHGICEPCADERMEDRTIQELRRLRWEITQEMQRRVRGRDPTALRRGPGIPPGAPGALRGTWSSRRTWRK